MYFQIKIIKSRACNNLVPKQVPWGNFRGNRSSWGSFFKLFAYFVCIAHFTAEWYSFSLLWAFFSLFIFFSYMFFFFILDFLPLLIFPWAKIFPLAKSIHIYIWSSENDLVHAFSCVLSSYGARGKFGEHTRSQSLVISNRTRAARLFDFEITRMISAQIALYSVQLPL